MMKKDDNKFIGKTRKEILEMMQGDQFNDPHSDVWIYYLGKIHWIKKKYLYLVFENEKVIRSYVVCKYMWRN